MPAIVKTRQLAASPTTSATARAAKDARSIAQQTEEWDRAHPPPPHRLKLPWAPDDPLGTIVDPTHEPANFFADLGKAILIGDTRGDRLGTWIAEDNRLLIFDRPPHAEPFGIPLGPVAIRAEHRVEIPVYSPWQGLIANNGRFSTCRLVFHLSSLDGYIDDEELCEKIILDSIFIGSHEQLEEPVPISKIGPRTLVNFYSGAPRACTFVNQSRHKIEIQAMILGQLGGPSHTRPSWWTDEDEAKLRKIPSNHVIHHRHDSTATHASSHDSPPPPAIFGAPPPEKDDKRADKTPKKFGGRFGRRPL